MARRKWWAHAPLLGVALLLAATCGEKHHDVLSLGGLRIERLSAGRPAASVGGVVAIPGDYLITGDGLRVLVGGMRRAGEARGAILEATLEGAPAEDSIVLLTPRIVVGSQGRAIAPVEMYVIEQNGKAVLRIDGKATIGERVVEVRRTITVADAGRAISMATRVTPEDREALDAVRVGARISWGGARPLLPGVGQIEDEAYYDSDWIARRGSVFATSFGYHETPAQVRAVFEQHGAAQFLSYTGVTSPRHDIAEGGSLSVRSALVLGDGSVAAAIRRLGWVRGAPFPEVLVTLPYAPEGSVISVRTAEGEPLLDTRPDARGQAIVPITPLRAPPEEHAWIALATAYGHAPSDEVAFAVPEDRRIVLEIPRGGRIRVTVTDAESGARLPARLRIRGVGGTADPQLGPEERAAGAVDTVITVEGAVTVPLAPGTYRVVVTHGIEWTMGETRVEVTETFRPDIAMPLRRVIDPGEWVGSDFHVHAAPSPDSQVTLEDRIAALVAEGIRFAVPTDHNYVTDYAPAIDALGIDDFGTIPGVEVTTWDPNYGHFNAYPWPLDPEQPLNGAPAYEHTTPAALFDALHEAGDDVIVQVNHPRMEHDIGYFEVMGLDARTGSASDAYSPRFDALEVWNGFDLARPGMFDRCFDDWLHLLARGQRVVATGNSDSHRVRYQWAGYPRTYVRVPGGRVDEPLAVVRAVRAGHAFVTSGPFLEVGVGDAGPGDTVVVEGGSVDVHVRVRAAPFMDVSQIDFYLGPELVSTEAVPPTAAGTEPPVVRFDGTVTLPVTRDTFLVVAARGERGLEQLLGKNGVPPLAFANPIWLARPVPRARPRPEARPEGDAQQAEAVTDGGDLL